MADKQWGIPAGILNSLWSDFFPRLVARSWRGGPAITDQMGTVGLYEALDNLALEIFQTVYPSGTYPTEPDKRPTATGDNWGSSLVMLRRARRILTFFDKYGAQGKNFPFKIAGVGGYDMVLSDEGVEFFMPAKPDDGDRARIIGYYLFRDGGRPCLGIAGYLSEGLSAMSVSSPIGPSQVEMNKTALQSDVLASLLGRRDMPLRHPGNGAVIHEEEELPDSVLVPLGPFWDATARNRNWQVLGAVYRAMMAELPRIVATTWLENIKPEVPLGPDHPVPVVREFSLPLGLRPLRPDDSRSYTKLMGDASDDGLRSIFKERLETMLPGSGKMAFGKHNHADSGPRGMPWWEPKDVMITNKGFYFPDPGDPPSYDVLLDEIARGRAGNPVFTDTQRTDE